MNLSRFSMLVLYNSNLKKKLTKLFLILGLWINGLILNTKNLTNKLICQKIKTITTVHYIIDKILKELKELFYFIVHLLKKKLTVNRELQQVFAVSRRGMSNPDTANRRHKTSNACTSVLKSCKIKLIMLDIINHARTETPKLYQPVLCQKFLH